jgi:hypothetical protein
MEQDLVRTYQVTPAQARALIMEVSMRGTAAVETDLDEGLARRLSAELGCPAGSQPVKEP